MRTTFIASAIAATFVAGAASAAITGVSGATTWLGVNPPNATQGALIGPQAYAWDEQTGVSSTALPVNLTSPGSYTGGPYTGLTAGVFASHMIHFEPQQFTVITGTVTFNAAIKAVIFDEQLLTISDGALGSFGTVYATGNPLRSFNSNNLGPSGITYAGNSLTFTFAAIPGVVNRMWEVRVLTDVVPGPGALAMAGLGGFVSRRRRSM
jgi:hypothetical protein